MYTNRYYRTWTAGKKLCKFKILHNESDIEITADRDLSTQACKFLYEARRSITRHISNCPGFLTTHTPVDSCEKVGTGIIGSMISASSKWDVGPMAAVAGTIAQYIGEKLSALSETVIVENGGDIYAKSVEPIRCSVYSGEESPFGRSIGFCVDAAKGVGICTSSGVVGPSHSYGKADAVTVVAENCSVADAAATSIANRIKCEAGSGRELSMSSDSDSELVGVIASINGTLGSRGIKLFHAEFLEGNK